MPIKITIFTISVFVFLSLPAHGEYKQTFIQKKLLINPAGDAHTLGRYIGESVERSITLHCAQKMKSYIESVDPTILVYLTRKAGDIVPLLQNAHFANCLDVNAVTSIHFYQETEARPNLFIYSYKDASSFIKPTQQLMLYPYYQAYLFNQEKTERFAKEVAKELSTPSYQPLFTTHTPRAFPALPLVGMVPLAIMIEMGIKDEHAWDLYIQPLCDAIIKTLRDLP